MSSDFDVVNTMDLKGFDPGNEPSLRFLANGALMLVFNAMPPFKRRRSETDFDHLALSLSLFLGTEVIHEDREFFLIPAPDQHSVERIQTFVAGFNRPVKRRKPDQSNAGSIKPQILKVLLPLVELLGFRIDERESFLIRDIPGGWQRIGVRLSGLRGHEAELIVSTRLEAVELLCGNVTPPGGLEMHTMLVAATNCGPGDIGPAKIIIIDAKDLPRTPTKWAPMLKQKVVPFLERYADVQALERMVNGDQGHTLGYSIGYRAFLGVLIAHVAAPERFDEVVQAYRAELEGQPDIEREHLEKALTLIKSGPPSRSSDVKAAPQIRQKAIAGWYIGESVAHAKFGEGIIVDILGSGSNARAQINFGKGGIKLLDLSVAKLERVAR